MFGFLKSKIGMGLRAAIAPAPPEPLRVKRGVASFPSFLKSTKVDDSFLTKPERRLASKDLTAVRQTGKTKTIIRDFSVASPDMSAAVWAYLRVGIPDSYTAVAKSLDGTFNREATLLVQQILTRFDLLPDYSEGFSGPQSIRSTAESLAKEICLEGACAAELVLGKDLLPRRIQPIAVSQVEFRANKDKTLSPVQVVGQDEIDLDIPTFVYVALDQDLLEAHASSFMESAIKPTLFVEDFTQDIHRIIKRVIHPRLKVKIDEEMLRKHLSAEAQTDAAKATEEINAIIADIENKVNGLRPEEALVFLDSLDFIVDNAASSGLSEEYKTLVGIGNARMTTGTKVMGTVLGHTSASNNIASTETMLFMKSATGAIKSKLDEVYSRLLTIAVRLFGVDATVEFRFADIDLRPSAELEAFRQTYQTRVLEQLSLGMISDEEACLKLTGKLPPDGMPKLSGTMFKTVGGGQASMGPNTPSNSGSTLNQHLNSDMPAQGRGQNKKAEVLRMVE